MNSTTQKLHDLGQSLWLDNISRELLTNGTLGRYIKEFSVTGLTSNPTIFDHAITHSAFNNEAIAKESAEGESDEELFFELALEDLIQAADLFRPVFTASYHTDGWVSMEISPLLAADTDGSIKAGLDPRVDSVASLFVSRWDVAVKDQAPEELRNRLGIAICQRAHRELLASPRWCTPAKTIVSRLLAIEELAGVNVLCAVKTGTLTQNKQ